MLMGLSINPLEKWFHLHRRRIANSLVRGKYEEGKRIIDFSCDCCDWNATKSSVFDLGINEDWLQTGVNNKCLYDYKVGEIVNADLPGESIDIVTMFELLEYLPDYVAIIKESNRLLKKGGYCIASVSYDTAFSFWRPLFFSTRRFARRHCRDPYCQHHCGYSNHFSYRTISEAFMNQGYDIEIIFNIYAKTIFLVAQKKGGTAALDKPYDDVTIILPTLNEEKNILKMLSYLRTNYKNSTIIVADDGSQDGTKDAVMSFKDSSTIFLDRGNMYIHGLTASVLDAIDIAKTKYVIVLDADGQHPPNKIGEVVNMLRFGSKLVVASRVDVEKKWGLFRKVLSSIGASLGKLSLLARGKNYISYDILSGFLGFQRNYWNESLGGKSKRKQFRLKGYKILFDFLKTLSSQIEIEKVYYILKIRREERSKINFRIYAEFLKACFLS